MIFKDHWCDTAETFNSGSSDHVLESLYRHCSVSMAVVEGRDGRHEYLKAWLSVGLAGGFVPASSLDVVPSRLVDGELRTHIPIPQRLGGHLGDGWRKPFACSQRNDFDVQH